MKGEPDDASADGERRANVDEVFRTATSARSWSENSRRSTSFEPREHLTRLTRDAENGEIQRARLRRAAQSAAATAPRGVRRRGDAFKPSTRRRRRRTRNSSFVNSSDSRERWCFLGGMDDFAALEKTYESCVGWSEFDTSLHLRFISSRLDSTPSMPRVRAKSGGLSV